MKIKEGTMEDILVRGVNEAVCSASKSLNILISFLYRSRRSETAERLQQAQRSLNEVVAAMSGVYGNRRA